MDRKYKDRNVKYFFMNTLFQKYFADYIHDNELYDDVSATIAATAPVTAPTFTPVVFAVRFGDLLQIQQFYIDLHLLFRSDNIPDNDQSITQVQKTQLQEFIKIFDEYRKILPTMDETFEKCVEYFDYIHDYLDSYNDPNEEKGDRNYGLNQIKTFLIPAIKRILDTIIDSSQVHFSKKLLAKQTELSNKSVVDYLRPSAAIYKEWVDKTYNNYHQIYQFFEAKYFEYDRIIKPLKEI